MFGVLRDLRQNDGPNVVYIVPLSVEKKRISCFSPFVLLKEEVGLKTIKKARERRAAGQEKNKRKREKKAASGIPVVVKDERKRLFFTRRHILRFFPPILRFFLSAGHKKPNRSSNV